MVEFEQRKASVDISLNASLRRGPGEIPALEARVDIISAPGGRIQKKPCRPNSLTRTEVQSWYQLASGGEFDVIFSTGSDCHMRPAPFANIRREKKKRKKRKKKLGPGPINANHQVSIKYRLNQMLVVRGPSCQRHFKTNPPVLWSSVGFRQSVLMGTVPSGSCQEGYEERINTNLLSF